MKQREMRYAQAQRQAQHMRKHKHMRKHAHMHEDTRTCIYVHNIAPRTSKRKQARMQAHAYTQTSTLAHTFTYRSPGHACLPCPNMEMRYSLPAGIFPIRFFLNRSGKKASADTPDASVGKNIFNALNY